MFDRDHAMPLPRDGGDGVRKQYVFTVQNRLRQLLFTVKLRLSSQDTGKKPPIQTASPRENDRDFSDGVVEIVLVS